MINLTQLPERGIIAVEGDDRVAFLQGLVSNDIETVRPGHAVWTALLTPQGKWLADFFVFADAEMLLLDCESAQVPMLIQRLSRYRLRMKVSLRGAPELRVHVAWAGRTDIGHPDCGSDVGALDAGSGIVAPDPRLPNFAWRILHAASLVTNATPDDWDRYRLAAGLPDGSKDMESDRSTLLEAGFDELSGVSWSKGCYMGQELTARTKYRGLVKRRLVPVIVDGPLPPTGAGVLKDGVDVGTMRSGRDGIGLALLRLDALGDALRCEQAMLVPKIPDWMSLPKTALTAS
jgi:tRNA-modifying protein YgfZ